MKRKAISDFTAEEKEWMDTIVINFIIAQADGYQTGYAEAIRDFTEYILDYWNGSDDKPQQSILDTLVDLGVELGKKKQTAAENIREAKKRGYEQYYHWEYKTKDMPFGSCVTLFTKEEEKNYCEVEE